VTKDTSDRVQQVALDQELHFKNGARGRAGDVVFTIRMLPKLRVSGPTPEIEQLQLALEQGATQGTVQLDTLHRTASWGGVTFELGYADVYQDDVLLTVRRP
jgi:hypothetical protein